jgi:hypothetical protein
MFKIVKECYQILVYCVFLLYITCFGQKLFTHNVFSLFLYKIIVWAKNRWCKISIHHCSCKQLYITNLIQFINNPIIIIGCIHSWGTTIGTMTPFFLVSWVLKQNECCEMLNSERRTCIYRLLTNKCYLMNYLNQLNKFWTPCSNIE